MIRNIFLGFPFALVLLGCYCSIVAFSGAKDFRLIEAGLKHFPIHLQGERASVVDETQLIWSRRGLGEKNFILCSLTENTLSHQLFQAIRDKVSSRAIPISMDLLFLSNCPPEDIFNHPSARSGIILLAIPTTDATSICLHSPEKSKTTHSTLDLVSLFYHSMRVRNVPSSDIFCTNSFYRSHAFLNELEKLPYSHYLNEGIPSFPHTLTVFVTMDNRSLLLTEMASVAVDIIRSVSAMSKNFHRASMPFISTSSDRMVPFLSYYLPFMCFTFSIIFNGIGIYTEKPSYYSIPIKRKIFWIGVAAIPTISPYVAQLLFIFFAYWLFSHASRNVIWATLSLSSASLLGLCHSSFPWDTFRWSAIGAVHLLFVTPLLFHYRCVRVCGVVYSLVVLLWNTTYSINYYTSKYVMLTDNPIFWLLSQFTSIVCIIDCTYSQW